MGNRDKRESKKRPEFQAARGYRLHRDLENIDRIADAFYNVERTTPEAKVPIPTLDAVIEAKDWVDNGSRL